MNTLAGKIAVITGAGRGLGAAFALSLADAGCELVLCGRRTEDLQTIATLVAERGGKEPEIIALDLAGAQSIDDAVNRIAARKDRVDILINNGAMWLEASDEPYRQEDVLAVINAAITGTFLFVQGLRPLMLASETPDVVTIGSISGLPNAALQSVSVPFYAAKRGQVALAEGLRQAFSGSRFRSILVNPPYLDDARPDQQDWMDAATRQKGERGTSRDVVEAALYALTRPRHISLTIDIDADDGGLYPPA
ncbi:SDR family oxidoreductase [Agrobacterium tumefaciens]|uniref:SDR family oxidoreductase n=1 Tax=Agrobacterium tumefaciens TaxID=358 RepID=UPI0021D2C509|nr:SDR family NAD(P)-dependent oxidoreductase [Agrobacterium tumefaciens]UXS01233.1 SDR family NAD(P)-dependent oxidoreductase [Agrobacterium tumefaciens]